MIFLFLHMHSDIGAISFIYKRHLLSLKYEVTKISANQFVYNSIHATASLRHMRTEKLSR